jgi:hypothetical protein
MWLDSTVFRARRCMESEPAGVAGTAPKAIGRESAAVRVRRSPRTMLYSHEPYAGNRTFRPRAAAPGYPGHHDRKLFVALGRNAAYLRCLSIIDDITSSQGPSRPAGDVRPASISGQFPLSCAVDALFARFPHVIMAFRRHRTGVLLTSQRSQAITEVRDCSPRRAPPARHRALKARGGREAVGLDTSIFRIGSAPGQLPNR